jgi:hypothetical protein
MRGTPSPTERGVADYCLVRGFYEFGLERTGDGWRINRMIITFQGPVEGYMGVDQVARQRAGPSTAAEAWFRRRTPSPYAPCYRLTN